MKNLLKLMFLFYLCSNTVLAQWEKVNGPHCERVQDIETIDSVIFGGTAGGLITSNDNGESWKFLETVLVNVSVYALIKNGITIFAGTDKGVYVSKDNGSTWKLKNIGLPQNAIVKALVFNGNNLFAGALYNGMFLSNNEGETWAPANVGMPLNTSVEALEVHTTKIYACTHNGLYTSENNGSSWQIADTSLSAPVVYAIGVLEPSIFAGTSKGIYISSDGGIKWSVSNAAYSARDFAVHGSLIFAGGNVVLLSTDNGLNWVPYNLGLIGIVNTLMTNSAHIFAGTYQGVCRSPVAGSIEWHPVNKGIPFSLDNIDVYKIVIKEDQVFAGTEQGLFSSKNHGFTWLQSSNGLLFDDVYEKEVAALAACDNMVYAGTDKGVFRSEDNGESWIQINNGLSSTDVKELGTNGSMAFVEVGYGEYHISADNGNNWRRIQSTLFDANDVSSVTLHDTIILVGTNNNGLFISEDKGVNWIQGSDVGNSGGDIEALTSSGTQMYAISDESSCKRVYRSKDYALTWESITSGIDSTSIEIVSNNGSPLVVQTRTDDVYLFSELDDSWFDIGAGLEPRGVNTIAVGESYIYAGVSDATDNGVYRRLNSVGIINSSQGEITNQQKLRIHSLHAPDIIVDFLVKTGGLYVLRLFTIDGKLLFTRNHSTGQVGMCTVKINSSKMPSGMYICQLVTGKHCEIQRFMIVR